MMTARRNPVAAVLLALAGYASAADAPAVDPDFLEFLGSDDSDDADWNALLTASTEPKQEQERDERKPAPAQARPAEAKKGES